MKFNDIKKYVISLKRRPDRRDYISQEMDYIGWDFTFFDAVDTNSYEGCALSHMEIAQLFLESKDQNILVLEDDTFFMPYSKNILNQIEIELNNTEWDFFTLAPSVNRPLNKSNSLLVDLSDLPPRNELIHRGIYGTSGLLYNRKIAEIITKWNTNDCIENYHKHKPIDEYIDLVILPHYKSFCAKYPIATQRCSYSDINYTLDNNHYRIMYNWRLYGENMPSVFDDQEYCTELKKNKTYHDISICYI